MTELAPATLQRLTRLQPAGKDAPPRVEADGLPLPVQLNPATLTLTRHNNVDRGGVTTGTQKAQSPSAENATLAFDLEFDTSEQGSGSEHVDVRAWTAVVRQFVEPPPDAPGKAPPAVQFAWGTLIFNGVVDQVTENLDYFAGDGTPLHAKVSLSITEQNFAYEAMKQGAAARDAQAATAPGGATAQPRPPDGPPPGAAPGSSGTSHPQQVVQASAGESAQQLLARLGLDPAAWRAAMNGLDSPLDLGAGVSVQLGPEVSAGAGLGASLQFSAGPALTSPDALVAALDPAGVTGPVEPGFTLAAAGGVAAARMAVQAYAVSSALATNTDAPASVRNPAPGIAAGAATATGPDPRALTYGWAVPLQRRAQPSTAASAAAGGAGSVSARARREELPAVTALTAPWERLPTGGHDAADAVQRRRDAGATTLRWRPGGDCS